MDTFRAIGDHYRRRNESAFHEVNLQVSPGQSSGGDRGVALVMVLWVVALLSAVVMEFAFAMRTETSIARNHGDGLKAYYVARGGFQYGVVETIRWLTSRQEQSLPFLIARRVTTGLSPQGAADQENEKKEESLWRPDGRPYEVTIPGGKCVIRIIDEGGKININWVPDRLLREVVGSMGVDPLTRDTVVDSILDWRDDNQLHHANGAEEPYYQSLPKPYPCKDGPLDILTELLLVKGVTREIYYGGRIGTTMAASIGSKEPIKGPGLMDLFTVYAIGHLINVNTAPKAVLEALPGIGPEGAAAIIQAREKKEFRSLQEFQSLLGQEVEAAQELLSTSPSRFFTIYAQGEADSGVRRAVSAVVRMSADKKYPSYKIVQWVDDAEII